VAQAEKRLATAQGKAEAGAGTKGSEASTLVHEGEERGAKITADVAEQQGAKTVATESKQPLTTNPPSETKPQGNLPSAPTAGQPTSGEPPGFEVRGVRIEDEPRSIMIRQGERPALTRPEVTALRNTETRLLRQKGQLMNEKTTLQHAQE